MSATRDSRGARSWSSGSPLAAGLFSLAFTEAPNLDTASDRDEIALTGFPSSRSSLGDMPCATVISAGFGAESANYCPVAQLELFAQSAGAVSFAPTAESVRAKLEAVLKRLRSASELPWSARETA